MGNALSILVHAGTKTGKSTFSSTAPTPILVLDAEGGWRFINKAGFGGPKLRKRHWNPALGPPPKHDGTWDVIIVTVTQWETLLQVYSWLTQAPHDFRTLVLDSITEMQRRLKANLRGTEQMRIQDWGDLLTRMDALIRSFRDLTIVPQNTIDVVVFIAETEEKNGKWRPAMQGQISRSAPYWMDIIGYLYVEPVQGPDGQPTGTVRKMLVVPHPQIEAGERVQGVLGDVVDDPHVFKMYDTIFSDEGIQESLQEVPVNG